MAPVEPRKPPGTIVRPPNGTDRPIAMVDGPTGARSYYHADRLGSVIALTDDSGAESARYTYDAYGVPFLVDPGTGALTQVAAGQPYLFTGRRFDFETGLYYYRARYYTAALGRFLQTDPIGYEDQMNLYAYVGNDPVNMTDPTGEFGWLGAAIGVLVEVAVQAYTGELGEAAGAAGRLLSGEGQKGDWGKVLSSGGKIIASGAAGFTGQNIARAVLGEQRVAAAARVTSAASRVTAGGVGGAAGGTVQTAGFALSEGRLPTGTELAVGFVAGAVTGALIQGIGEMAGEVAKEFSGAASKLSGEAAALGSVSAQFGVSFLGADNQQTTQIINREEDISKRDLSQ